ncbi:MAG UNVERIFIED_CONTAM: ATP-dependent metallopeptidase FtsH/Yme1/Tma family protein [Microcystis novacekii LVE1205-3]|jgi:cell division protease FtsH
MKLSWKTILLWTLPALVVGFFLWQGTFATATSNIGNNTASTRMTYGRFLEYLDSGRVVSVDLYEGGRTAIVQSLESGTRKPSTTPTGRFTSQFPGFNRPFTRF